MKLSRNSEKANSEQAEVIRTTVGKGEKGSRTSYSSVGTALDGMGKWGPSEQPPVCSGTRSRAEIVQHPPGPYISIAQCFCSRRMGKAMVNAAVVSGPGEAR